jgi:hypothetical protein
MRPSSWFLCPTLRLLPEASHQARVRLLFRVARTARKRGIGFVLRAQREPLQPLEAFGVEWAWVSWGSSSYGAITYNLIMRPAACGKPVAFLRWVRTELTLDAGRRTIQELPLM